MTEKKKKDYDNKGVNALIFILFWLVSLGFLQFSAWDIWTDIYNFVAVNFPAIFQRMWIAYILHGLIIGLGLWPSAKKPRFKRLAQFA